MCLRVKFSNENVPGDKAGFVFLGFVVCFVDFWLGFLKALKKWKNREKNGYMLIEHIHTPNYKMSNALISIIWAFRLFLDQPQQFSHGSKTTAKPPGTEVNCSQEWAITKWYNFCSRYLAYTRISTYLRCASNIPMLTVSTAGISDRVHSHWRIISSNNTKSSTLAMASVPK